MILVEAGPGEIDRLATLHAYQILDTPSELSFDRIARLAALVCQVPIAAVTFVDRHRQWSKAAIGLPESELPHSLSIACAVAALESERPVVVPDLTDTGLAAHPWVSAGPLLRFYAAAPLVTSDGIAIGVLEVMDRRARVLDDAQIESLETLASLVIAQLALGRENTHENARNDKYFRVGNPMPADAPEANRPVRLEAPQPILGAGNWELRIGDNRLVWSEEIYKIFGITPDTFPRKAKSFYSFVHPEDRQRLHADTQRAVRGGDAMDIEHRIVLPDGTLRHVHTRAVLIVDDGGEPALLSGTVHDITARKESEREVQRLAGHLHTTLESITDAFLTLDRQWRFTYLNSESERLLHRRRGDLLGKVIWDEFPELAGTAFETEARAAVTENRSVEFEALTGHTRRWYSMRVYPSEEGLTVYYRDVTENKKIESEMSSSAERFRAVARVTADAIWDWDLQSDHIWWSDGIRTLFDLDWCDIAADSALWVAHIHPDDRAAVVGSIRQAIEGDAPEWSAEYRFRRDDGSFSDVTDRAVLIRDAGGRAVRMVGGMIDITERKRTLAAMMSVAASVSVSSGTEFFQQLALTIADALGAQAAFVTRISPGESLMSRTVAVAVHGKVLDNFDYPILGTASEQLMQLHELEIIDGFDEIYPQSPLLPLLDVKAYAGRLLTNSAGEAVGLLFVAFSKPIRQSYFMLSALRIFASRAAAELDRRDADARIREQASLLDKAQDAIIVRGVDHRIQFWNKSAERLYGWRAEEVVGRSMEAMLFPHNEAFAEATRQVMACGEWSGEIAQQRKHGSTLMVEGRWTLVKDEYGAAKSILCINTDITQRKAAEHKIQHLAFYDSLTQLPNRLLLLERLQQAMAVPQPQCHVGALLFIDLDNFKNLNDTLGHDKGDLLLQQVAQRLTACLRDTDTVARLGGDEFVLMLEDLSDNSVQAAAQAEAFGHKIISSFNLPYWLDGYEYFSTPSIGVTLFNDKTCSVDELLKRADIAMYQAKACGRNAMRFFDPGMQAVVSARAELEADMRHGVSQNEFILHYQPQVLSDGAITGAEVLVRWEHPRRGLVSPMEFIPLAEDTGLIMPLGEYVLEAACMQLAAWAGQPELMGLELAVNVSAYQFRHPDFVETVLAILDHTRADPHKLKLELTESLLVANVEEIIAKMSILKARGVGFSLDDFGTGYSSLSYLKRLPLDQLKIDQSFIRDVLTDPNDAAIARTIVALGQSLGLAVIAEGVETETQREFLANNNCHAYQGYLFSKPLPLKGFEAFILNAAAPKGKPAGSAQ